MDFRNLVPFSQVSTLDDRFQALKSVWHGRVNRLVLILIVYFLRTFRGMHWTSDSIIFPVLLEAEYRVVVLWKTADEPSDSSNRSQTLQFLPWIVCSHVHRDAKWVLVNGLLTSSTCTVARRTAILSAVFVRVYSLLSSFPRSPWGRKKVYNSMD